MSETFKMDESLIDTDILSYYLNGDPLVAEKARRYLQQYPTFSISSITCFEILSGLSFKRATRQIQTFEDFIQDCRVLNITAESIRISADISGELRRNGITVGNSDLLIAGIAMENNLALITNNEKHFRPIPGLTVRNWKKA